MVKTSLSTYTIKAYPTNSDNNPLKLDNLNEHTLFYNTSQFNKIHDILSILFEKNNHITHNNKYLSIHQHKQDGDNIYYGELNYGPYGTEHEVVNAAHNELTEIKIRKEDSVITHYYFYMRFFNKSNYGLLILETKSNLGIKVIFEKWINSLLEEINCTHFKIKIETFLPKEIVDKFSTEGHIRKIRYLSHKLPKDKIMLVNGYEPEEGYVEYIVNIKKGKSKPHPDFLKKIFSKEDEVPEELMANINFPVEDIKLELELEDEKRTFTIGNISKAKPMKNISYVLELGDDGHRTFESIHNIAKKYAKDILESNF
ncbi:hypothetical protein [Methanobrevibacter sp.]|uniref:hypothetical protein n=1 Tax=Methanobrevibacter sp. TaxID=66852 RepID=UPI0026E0FD7D|nr:hypothetical protein [Methanobrevibacter sp.]MDO5824386.1 hypothetical protein [Methanobrevibacter sp.]